MSIPTTWRIKLRSGVTFQDGSPAHRRGCDLLARSGEGHPEQPGALHGQCRRDRQHEGDRSSDDRVQDEEPDARIHRAGRPRLHRPEEARRGQNDRGLQRPLRRDRHRAPTRSRNGCRATTSRSCETNAYWGKKPAFENVTIKFIANDAARVAALRSGSVDLIDAVPPGDVKTLSRSVRA